MKWQMCESVSIPTKRNLYLLLPSWKTPPSTLSKVSIPTKRDLYLLQVRQKSIPFGEIRFNPDNAGMEIITKASCQTRHTLRSGFNPDYAGIGILTQFWLLETAGRSELGFNPDYAGIGILTVPAPEPEPVPARFNPDYAGIGILTKKIFLMKFQRILVSIPTTRE